MNHTDTEIRPINDNESYQEALETIDRLFDALPGTPEAEILDVLVTLVEAYEKRQYQFPKPDPIEAIKYQMEKLGLSRRDLQPFIGTRARVSEILNKKRKLTLSMIRNLEAGLSIPAEVLIREYKVVDESEASPTQTSTASAGDDTSVIFSFFSQAGHKTPPLTQEYFMPKKETVLDCYVSYLTNTLESSTAGTQSAERVSSKIEYSSDAKLEIMLPRIWKALSMPCDEMILIYNSSALVSEEAEL